MGDATRSTVQFEPIERDACASVAGGHIAWSASGQYRDAIVSL